jgi:hypothetical protein
MDIPFEDLSIMSGNSENSNNTSAKSNTLTNTVKNTPTISGKTKKRGGIFGIFGSSKVRGMI